MFISPYTPPPWKKGYDLKMRLTVCCPVCGSDDYRMTHKKRMSIRHLQCGTCYHRWRRIHDHGVKRVLAASAV